MTGFIDQVLDYRTTGWSRRSSHAFTRREPLLCGIHYTNQVLQIRLSTNTKTRLAYAPLTLQVMMEMSSGQPPCPGPDMRKEGRRRVGVPEEQRRANDLVSFTPLSPLTKACPRRSPPPSLPIPLPQVIRGRDNLQ